MAATAHQWYATRGWALSAEQAERVLAGADPATVGGEGVAVLEQSGVLAVRK